MELFSLFKELRNPQPGKKKDLPHLHFFFFQPGSELPGQCGTQLFLGISLLPRLRTAIRQLGANCVQPTVQA